MESQFQVRTLSTVEALDEHAGVWERLGPDFEPPTREFAWVRESAAWLRGNARLSVLLLDQPGGGGIAPLVLGGSPVPVLRFVGSDYLHEPMDLVTSDPGSLTSLTDVLCRTGYPIILRPVGGPGRSRTGSDPWFPGSDRAARRARRERLRRLARRVSRAASGAASARERHERGVGAAPRVPAAPGARRRPGVLASCPHVRPVRIPLHSLFARPGRAPSHHPLVAGA